jgi:hypothetical protein
MAVKQKKKKKKYKPINNGKKIKKKKFFSNVKPDLFLRQKEKQKISSTFF